MTEVLHYTLHAVWARNRNHNEDSKSASPITDSQTAQAQRCTDRLG